MPSSEPTRAELEAMSDRTVRRYRARYERLGRSPRTLGWGSTDHQRVRFQAVVNAVELHGEDVLDWGCGFGDLYGFMVEAEIAPKSYRGVDLSPDLIAEASLRFDGPHVAFDVASPCDPFPEPESADVVVMLGLANYEQPDLDTESYARRLLARGFAAARKTIVCDFLSALPTPSYERESDVHYYDPCDVLTWGLELSPLVALRHDYPPIPQREFLVAISHE